MFCARYVVVKALGTLSANRGRTYLRDSTLSLKRETAEEWRSLRQPLAPFVHQLRVQ
jgi:hypothetical protein